MTQKITARSLEEFLDVVAGELDIEFDPKWLGDRNPRPVVTSNPRPVDDKAAREFIHDQLRKESQRSKAPKVVDMYLPGLQFAEKMIHETRENAKDNEKAEKGRPGASSDQWEAYHDALRMAHLVITLEISRRA